MKRDFIFTLLFGLTISLAFSQEFRLSGFVIDEEQRPVVLANVLLVLEDGTSLKGTVTDEKGFFEFTELPTNTYRVSVSYIQHTTESELIELTSDLEIKTLLLNSAIELEGITVTQQKPRVEQLADRIVFKVENTALSDNDIWTVLKKTPGVMVMNDKLYINGKPNVTVLINGRPVNLPEEDVINLLSGNSAGNVQAIEVITSPPAKYSAEGGMLIDIKMKKNLVSGYNGTIFNRYSQAVLPKHTMGTDHFFKGKKFDLSVNYSFNEKRNWSRFTDITNFFGNDEVNSVWVAEQREINHERQHNLNLFFDLDLNDKNSISVSTTNGYIPFEETALGSVTDIIAANTTTRAVQEGFNLSANTNLNTASYIDWEHKFNDKGASMSFNTHFTYYDRKNDQRLNSTLVSGQSDIQLDNDFSLTSDQIINLLTSQVDVTLPLNKESVFETGVRYAGINSQSNIAQLGIQQIRPGLDLTESARFNYDEQIYAGYVSLKNNWEKWNLNLGLRTEYTNTKGALNTLANATTNSYFDLFPTLSVSYTHEKNAFFFKGYRRILRPKYNNINPFQYFLTANLILEGNPNLRAEYRDYIGFDYVYDKTLKLVLFGGKTANKQTQQQFQDNAANLLRLQFVNLETNYYYGADISFTKQLYPFWDIFLLASRFYDQHSFRDLNTNMIVDNSIWTTFARGTSSFTLLDDKSLFADISFSYLSPQVYGNSIMERYSEVGLSIRKTFWNKKASMSLAVEDIFNDYNSLITRDYLDQSNSSYNRIESRLFVFGFRYKFGNTRISDNSKNKKTDEERRL